MIADKEVVNPVVGINVKARMDGRKLKQYELAKLADVSIATISDVIQFKKIPTVRILERIAKVLGCSMSQLFEEEAR